MATITIQLDVNPETGDTDVKVDNPDVVSTTEMIDLFESLAQELTAHLFQQIGIGDGPDPSFRAERA